MKRYVIIVAGGKGLRMGTELPKQFLPLKGKPVIIHTIEKFQKAFADIEIIVVMNEAWMAHFAEMREKFSLNVKQTVAGGETRFHSVKNGLDAITDKDGIVGIHDAVRPLISAELIRGTFEASEKHSNAIPAVSSKSSLRELTGEGNKAVDRSKYKLVQTPQCFDLELLKQAYSTKYNSSFTDDASVFEKVGHSIHLIDGEYDNFKITRPLDLKIAEELI